jgi:DNA polymerase-4
MAIFCRECTETLEAQADACPHCGSTRMIAHEELFKLDIAHIDCDAFYASVEKRDNPDLNDKPVIIGGGVRGVVSTCCYIARRYGVRSAMPMFKAKALCPYAVIIKPDIAKYVAVGQQIKAMMNDLTPLVMPISIDEAFLDLSGTETLHRAPPAVMLARFAKRVINEIGVTVSIGLSHNRFLAKIASDLDKPSGYAVIGKTETVSFLASRPVGILPGVGKVMQERLARDGITLIGDIQKRDETDMMKHFGEEGLRLARLAKGIDNRTVDPHRDSKSVSAETTFDSDISNRDELLAMLFALSEKVGRRLRREELSGGTVTLKLKTPDFKLITRSRQLGAPTQIGKRIYEVGRELLLAEPDRRRYRLIGIGVSHLDEASVADHGDLMDTCAPREAKLEHMVDKLRDKFGSAVVTRGPLASRRPKDKEDDA